MGWVGPTGLEISVTQSDGGTMVSAEYSFDVSAEGVQFTATCDPTVDVQSACAFTSSEESRISVSISTHDESTFVVSIIKPVGDLYNGDFEGPTDASLLVNRNGEIVGSDDFSPDYERALPNGEGCNYIDHAEETMMITAP